MARDDYPDQAQEVVEAEVAINRWAMSDGLLIWGRVREELPGGPAVRTYSLLVQARDPQRRLSLRINDRVLVNVAYCGHHFSTANAQVRPTEGTAITLLIPDDEAKVAAGELWPELRHTDDE